MKGQIWKAEAARGGQRQHIRPRAWNKLAETPPHRSKLFGEEHSEAQRRGLPGGHQHEFPSAARATGGSDTEKPSCPHPSRSSGGRAAAEPILHHELGAGSAPAASCCLSSAGMITRCLGR